MWSKCDWKEFLEAVDVFLPNAREARLITRQDDTESALRTLKQWVNVVVIKDGPRGAWVADGDQVRLVPGIDAGEAIDTTGAGDCFNAGFLYAYIREADCGCDLCVRYGNICGGTFGDGDWRGNHRAHA